MTLQVGASGNKEVSAITVGTAGGNKAVLQGWVGTASGNKQFFTSLTAWVPPALWGYIGPEPDAWVINFFIEILTGSTVNETWYRYEFDNGALGEWQNFPGGSLEAYAPDQPGEFYVRGQIRDGPNESDPIVFVTPYQYMPAP